MKILKIRNPQPVMSRFRRPKRRGMILQEKQKRLKSLSLRKTLTALHLRFLLFFRMKTMKRMNILMSLTGNSRFL